VPGVAGRRRRGARPGSAFQRSLSALDRPSARTLETLTRYDLERRYRKDPDGAIAALQRSAREAPEADLVYALAELSWVEGHRPDRWRKAASLEHYQDAVAYAFDYLFDPALADARNPSDPRFRLACEIYNGGLERLIRAARAKGAVTPGGTIAFNVRGKEQHLKVALGQSPWKAEDVDDVLPAGDFEVSGLKTSTYQYGLGVPLIGVHRPEEPGKAEARFFPPEMAFPLTAYLVPNSRLRDQPDGPRDGTLLLVDPVQTPKVGTPPADLPVEADLTTPLAYMWSRTDLNRYRWSGLFRPGTAMGRANLMLLRPYEPGKVPVVMVHGLISTPLAWVPMINELLNDPVVRQRYQFLLYMYPTGVPVTVAAAGLRESLDEARRLYDPGGRDPAFARMVLVGHSMGGLLAHAAAVDSGDHLWRLNSDRQFSEVVAEPEALADLRRHLFFKPLPYVSRVVFLGTPHRGSDMSRGVIGQVGARLIAEPDQIAAILTRLIKDNPDTFDARQFRRVPTSIETLDPDSPFLAALLAMTPNPEALFNSVIGALRPGPVAGTTDGVVPYRSAHVDFPGVESELVVRSDHGVQKAPEAIKEVRRILLRHVGASTAAVPPSATPSTAHRPDPAIHDGTPLRR